MNILCSFNHLNKTSKFFHMYFHVCSFGNFHWRRWGSSLPGLRTLDPGVVIVVVVVDVVIVSVSVVAEVVVDVDPYT